MPRHRLCAPPASARRSSSGLRRLFTYGYLKEEARPLRSTRYNPRSLGQNDQDMIDFFHWVASLPQKGDHEDIDRSPDAPVRGSGAGVVASAAIGRSTAQAADEAVHNELRALRDGLLDAMSKGDIERQLTYFHPNVVDHLAQRGGQPRAATGCATTWTAC